jgi:ADP-heptose:LPS heptosyltransferase
LRILHVRLRLIGDVASTTPLVGALRRHFPAAHLAYLVEPLAAPVIEHHPHLDRVHVAAAPRAPGRLGADLRLAAALRRERYDVVIDLHGGPRAAWLAWAAGAPRRIGYAVRGRAWMYTDAVARPAALTPRHAVENQWELLAPLDVPPLVRTRDPVYPGEPPGAEGDAHALLASAGIDTGHTLVLIHASAGNRFRQWPAARFSALAARLVAGDAARRVVLVAAPAEADRTRRLAESAAREAAPGAGRILSLVVPLGILPALIRRSAVYIGGDSGPLHLAGGTPTPVVGIFGATLPGTAMPWRDPGPRAEAVDGGPLPCRPCRQRTCAPGDFRCLTGVTVDAVAAAAERVMADAAARSAHA